MICTASDVYLRKPADELIRQHSEILLIMKRARKQAYRPRALNTKQKKEVKGWLRPPYIKNKISRIMRI